MRVLALARYRFLRTIRVANPVFAFAFLAAAVPVAGISRAFAPSYLAWDDMEVFMWKSALAVTVTYFLHLAVLFSAGGAFATRRRSPEGQPLLDLTETVPATSMDRFLGDAAGTLASLLTIHVCVLPILGLAVALSPLPAMTFFWLELVVFALAVFVSVAVTWNLHVTEKWRQTQMPRSIATFLVFAFVIVRLTTRGQSFLDAAWFSLVQPSPLTWKALTATISSPATLLAGLFLLYAAFIAWYAMQSVRALGRL